MYVNKSAPPAAPATSNVSSSIRHPDERGLSASPSFEIASKADAEPVRIHELPLRTNEESHDDQVVPRMRLMKPAAQRRQLAYLIPYVQLRELLGFKPDDDQPVALSADSLQRTIRMLLRGVHVDEEWYCRQYPDVRDAVAKGVFRTARHHFIESGYFEGRRPARVTVDEEWYARAYPDVSESVEFGELASCQEHFDRYGEREGRLPAED
jgi:hypothetical protein